MRYAGTRRSEHNPLRSLPLLKSVSAVFGPDATDRLVAELRDALSYCSGWEREYAKACAALGKANKTAAQWRKSNQRTAMRALNTTRAAMRANLRKVATLEAELLALAVPADRWADAAAGVSR